MPKIKISLFSSICDWASSCLEDLNDLKIDRSLEDIRLSTKKQFSKTLKISIQRCAFEYLISKRGSKGQDIEYSELRMAEYLQPGYENITIDEQVNIFKIRNRMIDMPCNFHLVIEKKTYLCEQDLNMKYLYICEFWCTD